MAKNHINIVSWNVNGIRSVAKKGLHRFMRAKKADIFAFQETKIHADDITAEIRNVDGYKSFWHSAERKGYSGVCFFTSRDPQKVTEGIGKEEFDCEGRVLTMEFEDFFLINAYFPNAQHELKRLDYKLRFNDALLKHLTKLRKKKATIVCGDFNVAHKEIDLKNPKQNETNPGFTIEERNWMDKYVKTGFVDTFRLFEKGPDHYTWWSYRFNARKRNIGWRIDYFCLDRDNIGRVKSSEILKDVMGSDHCPIKLTLQ